MNIFYTAVFLSILILCILAAIWIGVYVVLPVFLLFLLISVIGGLFKKIVPFQFQNYFRRDFKKNKENQIIDVEFEEIK